MTYYVIIFREFNPVRFHSCQGIEHLQIKKQELPTFFICVFPAVKLIKLNRVLTEMQCECLFYMFSAELLVMLTIMLL